MTKRQFICKAEAAQQILQDKEQKKLERTKERWNAVKRLPFLKDKEEKTE